MAAALREVFATAAKDLEASVESTGLNTAQSLMNNLNGIKDLTGPENGTVQSIERIFQGIEGFQSALQETLKNPSGLAPGGGCFSFCAQWYGSRVVMKLSKVRDEGSDLLAKFQALNDLLGQLMGRLSEAMNGATPVIAKEVEQLVGLPGEILAVAKQLEGGGFEAVKEVDMAPIERSIDVGPIDDPLATLTGAKQDLGSALAEARGALKRFADFKGQAPSRVRAAFDVGTCLPSKAVVPPAMQDMMGRLDALQAIDLSPLQEGLSQAEERLAGFDAEKVREPLVAFSGEARARTAKLVEALEAAKGAAQVGDVVMGSMKKLSNAFKKMF